MVLFSSFNHFNIFLLFAYLGLASGLTFFLVYSLSNFVKKKNNNFVKTQKSNQGAKNLSTLSAPIVEKIAQDGDSKVKSSTVFEGQGRASKKRNSLTNKKVKEKIANKRKTKRESWQGNKESLRTGPSKEEKQKLKQQNKLLKQERKQQIAERKHQQREHKKALDNIKKHKAKQALLRLWNKLVLFFKRAQNVLLTILCVVVLAGVVLGSFYANFVLNNGYLRLVFIAVWLGCFFLGGFVQKKVAKILSNFYNKTSKQKLSSSQTREPSQEQQL